MDIPSVQDNFTTQMSASDKLVLDTNVDYYNKTLESPDGKKTSNELGKDEFLKLLITQLQNQDPTDPMENTEFISQMAQFSSLEQMTNMSSSFTKMANYITGSEAMSTLGKKVDLTIGDANITGIVEGATRGDNPQILVNGMYYTMDKIRAVYAD